MKYLILIILFLGVSCSRQHETDLILDNARALMREEPAQALELLRTIRTEKLKRPSSQAEYALLYSQALDKNHIFRTDDSLIRIAVRYYERQDSPHEKAATYYYLGRVNDNRGDKPSAAKALFRARHYACETDDDYLKGLIENFLGVLYYNQYSFEEAIECFENSERHFQAAGLTKNMAIALEWQARIHYLHGNDHADSCYRKAHDLYKSLGLHKEMFRIQRCLASYLLYRIDTDSLKKYLHSIYSQYNAGTIPAEDLGLWSSIYELENNLDSARVCCIKYANEAKHISEYQVAGNYGSMASIEEKSGNYKKALEYMNRYRLIIDSLNREKHKNFIQEIGQQCKSELLEETNQVLAMKQHYQTIIILLLSVIFLFCGGVAIVAFRQWKRRAREQIRQAETELRTLRTTYDGLQKRMASLQEQSDKDDLQEAQLYKALEERMIGLRDLIATSQTIKPSLFIKNFQKYAGVNVNSRHALSDLQFVVNRKYNGVVDYLKAHYPELTKHDLDLCCLLCFGFSQQAICYMYDYGDIGSFYNKRSRLRHKLKLPADYKIEDFFTDLLQQLAPQVQ